MALASANNAAYCGVMKLEIVKWFITFTTLSRLIMNELYSQQLLLTCFCFYELASLLICRSCPESADAN